MPAETYEAVLRSLDKEYNGMYVNDNFEGINTFLLTYSVREYFNENDIEYSSFNFEDVKPFIPKELLN